MAVVVADRLLLLLLAARQSVQLQQALQLARGIIITGGEY
jgi:gamma-glutamyl-gamma-aminobutyrate hydrolase PuuD